MNKVHKEEKQQFQKLFKQTNIDRFEDRFKIMEALLGTEQHVTDKQLVKTLEKAGLHYDIRFIKDTLNLMCHFGFAQTNQFNNGHVRYEHRHLGQHHDHMVCTKCGTITEFQNDNMERLQRDIAASSGFHMLQHKMEIYGICGNCLKERMPSLPLVNAKQGERLVIKDFIGGSASRMRLLSMGLRPGDELEVITNLNKGQIVVSLDYHRYAIGRGLAQKILTEPVEN